MSRAIAGAPSKNDRIVTTRPSTVGPKPTRGAEPAGGIGPAAAPGATIDSLYAAWRAVYAGRPFVQILASGETPDTAHVVGTNRLDLAAVHDARTGNFVITSAEDNLVKGASGQAVQIMNLWCGYPETAGLV